MSLTSVTIRRPVCSRASARYSSALALRPLERVGRGSRFVGPAAQELDAKFLEHEGDLDDLGPALHRAGPRDDRKLGAADRFAPHVDDRVLGLGVAADELEGLGDRYGIEHAGEIKKGLRVELVAIARDSDREAKLAGDFVGRQAHGTDFLGDAVDIGALRVATHND